jgi:hypothetical protein
MLKPKRVEAREAMLYRAPRFVPWVYAFNRVHDPVFRSIRSPARSIAKSIAGYCRSSGRRAMIASRGNTSCSTS